MKIHDSEQNFMKIFDLEQDIMSCWNVCEDIDVVTSNFIDAPEWEGMDSKVADALMNRYFGIKELYDVKFQKLWTTFEAVCKEHHELRKRAEYAQKDSEIDWDRAPSKLNSVSDGSLPFGYPAFHEDEQIKYE